jgi:hypothetical protein
MILLMISLALAEEPTFTNLKEGEEAPFDGRLFNDAAVSKLITEHKMKDLDCDLEIEYQVDLTETQKQYEYDLLNAQCTATKYRLEEINKIKEQELQLLRKDNKPFRPYLWMTGGFVMGTAASIAIFKTVSND